MSVLQEMNRQGLPLNSWKVISTSRGTLVIPCTVDYVEDLIQLRTGKPVSYIWGCCDTDSPFYGYTLLSGDRPNIFKNTLEKSYQELILKQPDETVRLCAQEMRFLDDLVSIQSHYMNTPEMLIVDMGLNSTTITEAYSNYELLFVASRSFQPEQIESKFLELCKACNTFRLISQIENSAFALFM